MAGSIKVTIPLDQISERLTYDATSNSLQFDLAVVEWVANGFIEVGQSLKKDTQFGAAEAFSEDPIDE